MKSNTNWRKYFVAVFLVAYYAFLHENPLSKLDPKLQKSQTTLEILQIIRENPGIHQNQIANIIGLKDNTVKYHLDKFLFPLNLFSRTLCNIMNVSRV